MALVDKYTGYGVGPRSPLNAKKHPHHQWTPVLV